MCGSDICLGIIAIIFPPIAVWVKRGLCSVDSLINIALCMLGFLPGLLHAWYIIAITPEPTYDQIEDEERGHVTHYHVHGRPQYAPGGGRPQQGYGTVSNAPNAQFPGQQNGFVQPPPQAGSSDQAPPSYTQAIQGDNKVQGP